MRDVQPADGKVQSIVRGLKRYTGLPLIDGNRAQFEPSRSLGAPWLLTEIWLALVVYRLLRMRIKASEALGVSSVERLLETLETVQLHQVHLDGEAIQGISMDAAQRDLFKHLEVKPPHRDQIA